MEMESPGSLASGHKRLCADRSKTYPGQQPTMHRRQFDCLADADTHYQLGPVSLYENESGFSVLYALEHSFCTTFRIDRK